MGLFRRDGIHLSEIETDIFNTDLSSSGEMAMVRVSEDRRA